MKALKNLPDGYQEIFSVDLQKDKKIAVLVNILALIIAVVLLIPANFKIPILTFFDVHQQNYGIKLLAVFASLLAYIILHEIVHGIAMKICGTQKVKYGFTGLYAFAGSEDYYNKKSYIFIALAPIVFWGIVLAVINVMVPIQWFWGVYFIQVMNLSGAAGDCYVTVKFLRLPKDILVKDSGIGMKVYSKQ